MLNSNALQRRRTASPCAPTLPSRERGVVLLVALIVLVVMTLAGIGLARSVFTGNRIAGNLAFQQAATQAADTGVETAIAWLEAQADANPANLFQSTAVGASPAYFAARQDPDPATNQSWEAFWRDVLEPSGRVNVLAPDPGGNTVSYVIQRLCNNAGDPTTGAGCASSPVNVGAEGNSKGAGVVALLSAGQQYYRITVRVLGPRNAVSFVQAVVAI